MEAGDGVTTGNSNDACCRKSSPCRPRDQLEYIIPSGRRADDETWRCPACHAHYEDPVFLSCGDTVCRSCVAAIGGVCPTCSEKFTGKLCSSRVSQRQVKQMQCHCPNRGLGCEAVVGVLDVEHHLGSECEWREEECDQCHQQVRRAEMARHKDTTCARKPMACGYADVGCETRCAQDDLAAHERDGVVAHMGLLRQCLAGTSLELAQTRHELAATASELTQTKAELAESRAAQGGTVAALSQTQHDLAQTKEQLTQCEVALAQTKEQNQHDLAAVRLQLDQVWLASGMHDGLRPWDLSLALPPPAPEGLEARLEPDTGEVAISWQPVPPPPDVAPYCPLSVCYRVEAALPRGRARTVIYLGLECRCWYRCPTSDPGAVPFAVVAMRGLAESRPCDAAIQQPYPPPPGSILFTYDHDMDERGLFYYLGTQGRSQPWQNPAEAGWVTATRSSESGFGKASELTGREACNSSTASRPRPSWWQVDLGAGRLFTPTRYTLRHSYCDYCVESRLQSWRLEGSVDGAEGSWRTLDEHTNEPYALAARPDAMATFAVAPARAFPARLFRVLMTGPSPSGRHYLVLSGLEMYGSLLPRVVS
ncbi:putative E3 ubiquitin-protein ligase HECTD1 [Paratrimastix pyriformis]|uniref:E3 ubiquitin-protein ligase HECTD1 n=1 Tax=Paratrimastix pyriformis TaxID=342808 RepID=A0ABQ8UJR1_9EUKA|nr:putative E3 ubiquitin-protein ligase HECTD1 [Paratrimastix pyriformis]